VNLLGPSEVGEEPGRPSRRSHDWRWWVGGVGRTAIATGVLLLLFVAYQLWGTNLQEARSQDELSSAFTRPPAVAGTTTTAATPPEDPTVSTVPGTAVTTTEAPTTTAPSGKGIARIQIRKIGVDKIVVQGVGREDLKQGPGHYPDTPLPGSVGNVAIAGHRTTYGAPFNRINELVVGDEIDLTNAAGTRFRYLVTQQLIVSPSDYSVIASTPDATLTLTSCHPKYSAAQRIVVKAKLDPTGGAPAITTPTTRPAPTTTAAASGSSTSAVATTAPTSTLPGAVGPTPGDDPLGDGWFADSSAWLPTILWGLVVAAVAIGAWVLARRRSIWPRLGVYAAATIPFLVVLYFFFENVSRLLPPGI
jgi:sortase A